MRHTIGTVLMIVACVILSLVFVGMFIDVVELFLQHPFIALGASIVTSVMFGCFWLGGHLR